MEFDAISLSGRRRTPPEKRSSYVGQCYPELLLKPEELYGSRLARRKEAPAGASSGLGFDRRVLLKDTRLRFHQVVACMEKAVAAALSRNGFDHYDSECFTCPHCGTCNKKLRFFNDGVSSKHFCKACRLYWTVQAASSSHNANPNETYFNMPRVAISQDDSVQQRLKQGLIDVQSLKASHEELAKRVHLVNITDTANEAAHDAATVCIPDSPVMMMQQQQQPQALRCPHCHPSNTKFGYNDEFGSSQPGHLCMACKCSRTVLAGSSSHDANPNDTYFNTPRMALPPDNLEQLHPDASLTPSDVVISIPPEVGTNPRSFSSSPHPPASPEDDGHRVQPHASPAVNENNAWLLDMVDPATSAQAALAFLQLWVGNRTSLSPNARTLLCSSLVFEGLGFAILQSGRLLSRRQNRGFLARFLLKCGYLATVCGLAGAVGMILPEYLMFWIIGIVCLAYAIATFLPEPDRMGGGN